MGARKVISSVEDPPIAEILKETNILKIIVQILSLTDTSEETRCMKVCYLFK